MNVCSLFWIIIFEHCKRYGISLNPKKSLFALDQGKLLGFIVSKDGIYIDPDRIKDISYIPFPHNKKIHVVIFRSN